MKGTSVDVDQKISIINTNFHESDREDVINQDSPHIRDEKNQK